jgi:hypothetical protein
MIANNNVKLDTNIQKMGTPEIRAILNEKNVISTGSKSEIKNKLQEFGNNLFSSEINLINDDNIDK